MLVFCVLALLAGQAFCRSSKIIGGEDASPGAWPHQGSLQYFGSHSCGCVLISDTWVVTAAHCVTGSVSFYSVILGATDLSDDNVGNPTSFSLASIRQHEKYEQGEGAYPNDIALIQLSEAASFDDFIAPIALANAGDNFEGQKGYITGWGYVRGGGIPDVLQQAEINIYTRAECELVWSDNINDGHVCIGDTEERRGSCNGDSGGPLVAGDVLVGVTSWGVLGCNTQYPSVYTGIAFFRDWIRTNSGV